MDKEQWIRVMLDDGRQILLKGTGVGLSLGDTSLRIAGSDGLNVGVFPLCRIVGVVNEKRYQEGLKKSAECCTDSAECES